MRAGAARGAAGGAAGGAGRARRRVARRALSAALAGAVAAGCADTPADRAGWRARLRWPDGCEQGFALVAGRGTGVETFPLGGGRRLAQVACAPGAYQGTYAYFLVPGAGAAPASPLAFPDVVEGGGGAGAARLAAERTTEVVGLPTFDTSAARLRVLRRFRGAGDCGLLLTYAFEGGAPTLAELRGKLDCDGRAPPPERWPVLAPPRRAAPAPAAAGRAVSRPRGGAR